MNKQYYKKKQTTKRFASLVFHSSVFNNRRGPREPGAFGLANVDLAALTATSG